MNNYSRIATIRTVAAREIAIVARSKGIIIALVITLLLMIAGIGVATYFKNKDDDLPQLVLVGVNAQAFKGPGFEGVETREVADRAEAEQLVKEDADSALVKTDDGYELLSDGKPSPQISSLVSFTTAAIAHNQALDKVGVDLDRYQAALPPSEVRTVDISGDEDANLPAVVTIMFGVTLMSFAIMLFAGIIAGRVTEEKSSRVVEIILASARPLDFLTGKLLGAGAFGIIATVALLGVGAGGLAVTGLMDGLEFDYSVVPMLLLGFIIGFLFFGSLYAAAGSLVSRTEDLQSTQTPILILMFGMIYVPGFGISALDSTVMQVLAWVPPFSLAVAPLQFANGSMGVGQVLGSYVVCAIATVLVLLLVARIYRNAILNNGKRMSWREAFKSAS